MHSRLSDQICRCPTPQAHRKEVKSFYSQLKCYNQVQKCNLLLVVQRAGLELMDRSSDMPKTEDYLERSHADMLLFLFGVYTMQSRCILGNLKSAVELGEIYWKCSGPLACPYFLFSALTAFDHWKKSYKKKYWKIFRRFHKDLDRWSKKGNPNATHLLTLLDAELLVTQNAEVKVINDVFDKAKASANNSRFLHI
jgi:hypothetical protein